MAVLWDDGTHTVAAADGPVVFTRPFDNDAGAYLLSQSFRQFYQNYISLALNTVHPTYTNYYLVQETPLVGLGNGLVQWNRVYAQVPASRNVFESYSYRRPGLGQGGILNTPINITNVITTTGVTTITTASVHGLSIGNTVAIAYQTQVVSAFEQGFIIYRPVLSTPTTSTFTVTGVGDGTLVNPRFLTIQKSGGSAPFGRPPNTVRVVKSKIQLDYYLPGITPGITYETDIPIISPTVITDVAGFETDTYVDGFEPTSPTQTAYSLLVTANTYVVVEASILRLWKGNIFERATRYVIAQ
jgi:hypothetical protein